MRQLILFTAIGTLLLGGIIIGVKISSPEPHGELPSVVDDWQKPYHDKFNREVANLIKRGCQPSFQTKIGWSAATKDQYTFDSYVNRWENKTGGYTYFVKSWSDGEERTVEDRDLGMIVPCRQFIKDDKWMEKSVD